MTTAPVKTTEINPHNARFLAGAIFGLSAERINPEIAQSLFNVLQTISPREQLILSLHFGLYSSKNGECTQAEVGGVLHVTGERIRQIEARAIRKLRHPSRSRQLRKYIIQSPGVVDEQ